jgi:hypothetical protein
MATNVFALDLSKNQEAPNESCVIQLSTSTDNRIHEAREAWARLRRHETFRDWLLLGRALAVGQAYAIAKAGKPKGSRYNNFLKTWLGNSKLPNLEKSVRSRLLECVENSDGILAWLDTIENETRLTRLNHPTVVLNAWKGATGQLPPRQPRSPALGDAERLQEILRTVDAQRFLEIAPREFIGELETRFADQQDELSKQRRSSRPITKAFQKIVRCAQKGEASPAAAREIVEQVKVDGRELGDLRIYYHDRSSASVGRRAMRGNGR